MFRNNDKTEKLSIRLTKDQVDFIADMCEKYGFTTSEYLRMVINHQKYIVDKKKENEKNEY